MNSRLWSLLLLLSWRTDSPPCWIFTRWKNNNFLMNTNVFTLSKCVCEKARILFSFIYNICDHCENWEISKRVFVSFPPENFSFAVVVSENCSWFFEREKMRNSDFSWRFSKVNLLIHLTVFISRDLLIIFESIATVIVQFSSSVLNGIFSRSNQNHNQTREDYFIIRSWLKLSPAHFGWFKSCLKFERLRKLRTKSIKSL